MYAFMGDERIRFFDEHIIEERSRGLNIIHINNEGFINNVKLL